MPRREWGCARRLAPAAPGVTVQARPHTPPVRLPTRQAGLQPAAVRRRLRAAAARRRGALAAGRRPCAPARASYGRQQRGPAGLQAVWIQARRGGGAADKRHFVAAAVLLPTCLSVNPRRLAVRVLDADGTPLQSIAPAVSEPFVVTTTRVRGNVKPRVPLTTDPGAPFAPDSGLQGRGYQPRMATACHLPPSHECLTSCWHA